MHAKTGRGSRRTEPTKGSAGPTPAPSSIADATAHANALATAHAPGHPAAPATTDAVLELQRQAGNQAVASALTPAAPLVTWTAPADVTSSGRPVVCTDRAQVAQVLADLSWRLRHQGSVLEETAEQTLNAMADQIGTQAFEYANGGGLSARDPAYLTGYVQLAQSLAQREIQAAVTRCLTALREPAPDPRELENLIDQLNEEAHLAFIAGKKDALKPILEAVGKVTSLTGKVKSYAGKVEKVMELLTDLGETSKLSEIAKKVGKVSGAVTEQINKAKDVVEVVRDIATFAGLRGSQDATVMTQDIDKFAAGMDGVDKVIGKFGAAVPAFGAVWKIYKSMIDACVTGLRRLATIEERETRVEQVAYWAIEDDGTMRRDGNGAPIIDSHVLARGIFPGGQAVFSYVYAVRAGNSPVLTEAVRDYFLDRTDLFNVDESRTGSGRLKEEEWSLFSPSTWSRSGRENNVGAWVKAHIDKVWALLYGDVGRDIPY